MDEVKVRMKKGFYRLSTVHYVHSVHSVSGLLTKLLLQALERPRNPIAIGGGMKVTEFFC